MSFLNPVNEPVLRFSSTDAGAPQINYNARVAGDVKAVLKACLVTGYGSTASAGWSIVNEVGHVAEFVSPSASMSDYRLGINDTSAENTTWYYHYQDARVDPVRNTIAKTPPNINNTYANNGWQLLATQRGIFFVETVASANGSYLISRMTYFGQLKSALKSDAGKNIAFLTVGLETANYPSQVLAPSGTTLRHYTIGGYAQPVTSSVNIDVYQLNSKEFGLSDVCVAGNLMLRQKGAFIAEQPALLLNVVNKVDDLFGATDIMMGDRPALRFCIAPSFSGAADVINYGNSVLIYLDYWEY